MKKFLAASLIALMAGTAYAATDEAKENAVSTDATAATAEKQPETMSLAKLKLGGKEITVMIAETEEQRKQGLMNVERMDENNEAVFDDMPGNYHPDDPHCERPGGDAPVEGGCGTGRAAGE